MIACSRCGRSFPHQGFLPAHLCIPGFDYIPTEALVSLANRFAKGEVTHKDDPMLWNAKRPQKSLDVDEWVRERARHAILHITHALEVLDKRVEDDGDDDAGAILWFGAMLAARRARHGN